MGYAEESRADSSRSRFGLAWEWVHPSPQRKQGNPSASTLPSDRAGPGPDVVSFVNQPLNRPTISEMFCPPKPKLLESA